MNRRDMFRRLAAAGLIAAEPEIVRRFWPGWAVPTFDERAAAQRARYAKFLGMPDPGEPQEWDFFADTVTRQIWLYHEGRWERYLTFASGYPNSEVNSGG